MLCGAAVIITSLSLTEGLPLLCHNCEEKKQPHIEVSQPTGVVQELRSSIIAGVTGTVSASPSPSRAPELSDSEV